jgi:hypothetical protein
MPRFFPEFFTKQEEKNYLLHGGFLLGTLNKLREKRNYNKANI